MWYFPLCSTVGEGIFVAADVIYKALWLLEISAICFYSRVQILALTAGFFLSILAYSGGV